MSDLIDDVIWKFNHELIPLVMDLMQIPDLLTPEEEEVNITLDVLNDELSGAIRMLEYEKLQDSIDMYYYYKNNADLDDPIVKKEFELLRESYHQLLTEQIKLLQN